MAGVLLCCPMSVNLWEHSLAFMMKKFLKIYLLLCCALGFGIRETLVPLPMAGMVEAQHANTMPISMEMTSPDHSMNLPGMRWRTLGSRSIPALQVGAVARRICQHHLSRHALLNVYRI